MVNSFMFSWNCVMHHQLRLYYVDIVLYNNHVVSPHSQVRTKHACHAHQTVCFATQAVPQHPPPGVSKSLWRWYSSAEGFSNVYLQVAVVL
jgi:hypothetical protein